MAQVQNISKKSEDIAAWYQDVIREAKLAEHGPTRGSMIFRPYGYAIWESVQSKLDKRIKAMGVDNAYFPLFIPMSFLEREKDHVEGFAPELAVVTHGGGEKLSEPMAVRPTSETIIYDAFSRWIQSFRDLPLKVNQWCSVVRWEKRPNLFLRSTEFLWQEGHTAHQTEDDAMAMVKDALDAYIETYQKDMALFGYSGKKSESEKFAGAKMTLTYECLMPDGKVVQSCTSHNLGQNFAKVFNVKYQDDKGEEQYVWQTSWGFSTRSLGALFLQHGDDNGLILPPKIAPIQVVIIPILSKGIDEDLLKHFVKQQIMEDILDNTDIRIKVDDTDQSPGWKFNQYELEGVPVRVEIGAKELDEDSVKIVRRDNKESKVVKLENLKTELENVLWSIQDYLFEKSKVWTIQNTFEVDDYEKFKEIMDTTRGFIKAFWCEDAECEAKIKEETKATTRCLPEDSKEEAGKCIYCGKDAKFRWLFAQSY